MQKGVAPSVEYQRTKNTFRLTTLFPEASAVQMTFRIFKHYDTCNAQKGNRDDTDFRNVLKSYEEREPGCRFCDQERVIASNELCYAIRDGYPVTELHTLVIPKRHIAGFFELYQPEINAIHRLLRKMKEGILERDSTVTSFNIGVNSGEEAGQTINHCHFHLIPRRKGDVDDPTGGVRGVIPEKQNYT